MLKRHNVLTLVQTLRAQANIIELCNDTQEFEEAIAAVYAALQKVEP